ncbi:MAG: GIY-YIG nuclease family protein [Robiginitomaculum sp.]|nr:GIY-YIG nuclease family protein [Robiginitomaculum sp.]
MNEWVVYILRCRDNSLYTGITNNMEKRLKAHNGGKGAKYTKARRPVVLVYEENAANRSAAQIREAEIKKLTRVEKLGMISG